MSSIAYGKAVTLAAGVESTYSQAVDSIRAIRVTCVTAAAPIYFTFQPDTAVSPAVTAAGDNTHVLVTPGQVMLIPYNLTGRTIFFSIISTGIGSLHIELVRSPNWT